MIELPAATRIPGRRVMLLGAAALLLNGCGGPAAGLPPVPEVDASVYRLGPGDQIRIITFGEQQLTGEFRVDAAGDIALQLDGAVAAALSKAKLYRNPSVSTEVIAYRPIFVLGEVSRPGQYPYQPGMTVVTAVAVSGGFTYRAVQNQFSIVRNAGNRPIEGVASRETGVQPGDVITVFERIF
jgi:polysaccharide biosynthesis/export protein